MKTSYLTGILIVQMLGYSVTAYSNKMALRENKFIHAGEILNFESYRYHGTLVLAFCTSMNPEQCDAVVALNYATMENLEYMRRNPDINLGAAICLSQFHGKIEILQDLSDRDRSFCLFQDDSMIENSVILKFADINDLEE